MKGWLLALLIPAILLPPHPSQAAGDVDEAKIVACVASTENEQKTKPPLDPEVAADKCIQHETAVCMETATKEWSNSAAYGVCLGSELAVWQKLLAQAYEAMMTSERERNRLASEHPERGPALPALLPALIEAHEKWEAFVTAECAVSHIEVTGGTYAQFGVSRSLCAIRLTARRVFLYRDRVKTNEFTNSSMSRPK